MNDDKHLDAQYLLASAYLDGELDHAERAAAHADPGVMALVAELRALQEAVSDAPAPDPARRSAAINAAMAEYQAAYAGLADAGTRDASGTPGTSGADGANAPISLDARRASRWSRQLTLAAAAVAVLAVGGIVAASINRGNGSDADLSSAPSERVQQDAGAAERSGPALELGDDSYVAPDPAPDAADEVVADGGSQADSSNGAPPAATAAPAAPAPIDMTMMTAEAVEIPEVTDPDALVESPEQLTGLGLYLLQAAADGEAPPTPNTRCVFEGDGPVDILAEARYALDGTPTDVLVAVDTDTSQAYALDPDDCALLVAGPIP